MLTVAGAGPSRYYCAMLQEIRETFKINALYLRIDPFTSSTYCVAVAMLGSGSLSRMKNDGYDISVEGDLYCWRSTVSIWQILLHQGPKVCHGNVFLGIIVKVMIALLPNREVGFRWTAI